MEYGQYCQYGYVLQCIAPIGSPQVHNWYTKSKVMLGHAQFMAFMEPTLKSHKSSFLSASVPKQVGKGWVIFPKHIYMHYKLNTNINIYLQRKIVTELEKLIRKFPDLFHWFQKLEI